MPGLPFYSLVVPATGYAQKFPTIQPLSLNNSRQMAVSANPGNSAPIMVGGCRLQPGASITMNIGDVGSLFLYGAIGDGVGYTY